MCRLRLASFVVLMLVQQQRPAGDRALASMLSCRGAAALVEQKGAVALSTGRFTFDRYVRDQSFCDRGETIEPAWAPTADNPQCFIGYTCGRTIGGIP